MFQSSYHNRVSWSEVCWTLFSWLCSKGTKTSLPLQWIIKTSVLKAQKPAYLYSGSSKLQFWRLENQPDLAVDHQNFSSEGSKISLTFQWIIKTSVLKAQKPAWPCSGSSKLQFWRLKNQPNRTVDHQSVSYKGTKTSLTLQRTIKVSCANCPCHKEKANKQSTTLTTQNHRACKYNYAGPWHAQSRVRCSRQRAQYGACTPASAPADSLHRGMRQAATSPCSPLTYTAYLYGHRAKQSITTSGNNTKKKNS